MATEEVVRMISRQNFEKLNSIIEGESYGDVIEALGRIALESIPRKDKDNPLENVNVELMEAALKIKKVEPWS